MKQKLLLLFASCFIVMSSFATIHTITVGPSGGNTFSPGAVTVHIGDTVTWVWESGTHTTTSTTIPSGAAPWNQNITSSATSFTYVPTVLGTYNYICSPHAVMGMLGTFTVAATTGTDPLSSTGSIFNIYPNPAVRNVLLTFCSASPARVVLTDINGRKVTTLDYKNVKNAEISLDGIPDGLYVVNVIQDGDIRKQKLVIVK